MLFAWVARLSLFADPPSPEKEGTRELRRDGHAPPSALRRAASSIDLRCTTHLLAASTWRERARLSHAVDATKVRTDGDLTLWQTSAGPVWTPPRAWGEHVARTFHVPETGRWTRIDGQPSLVPVRKGDVVIDGGAHVGDSPRHALLMGAAKVVAVEPDPDNLRALRRNLAREIKAGQVIVVPKGIYDREGSLTFVRRNNSWDGEFHEGHGDGDALPVTTIDRIVRAARLERVDLIKLDIEGSEVPALRGAVRTIRRFKPRMAVAAYHKPGDFEGVQRAVAEARRDYEIAPSRCLPYDGRLFPNLLFFH
jgi:FkbM family methyltransferase